MTLAVAVLAVAVGYLVKGVVGFGTVLVAMPLLLLVLPPADAVLVLTATDIVGGGVLAWRARRWVPWQAVVVFLPPMLVGQWAGTGLLAVLDVGAVRRVLAVLVAAMAVTLLRRPERPEGSTPPTGALGGRALGWGVVAGVGAGLCSGLVGAPGPVTVAWVRRFFDDQGGRAAMLWIFLATSTTLVGALLGRGVASPAGLWLAAACVPAALAGGWVGAWVAPRVSAATFGRAVGLVLAAAAVGLWLG